MTQCEWYAFDSNTDSIWWHCRDCGNEKRTATAARHLNNAIAAVYANAGASAVLADLRKAMELLEIREDPDQTCHWEHWFSQQETEWEEP